jgi:tetratricopeptide (TPR) repeat protein
VTFLPRVRPLRLLFWLVLALPAGLLLYVAGRHVWADHHRRAAERELERYAFGRALPHLEACLSVWPDSLPTRVLAARTARRAGRLDETRVQLEECRRLAPAAPEVLLETQLLRCQTGGLASADEEDLLAAARAGHPEAGLILEALTLGYLYSYRLGRARECADLLLAREPGHVQAHVWRGFIREGTHHYDEALEDYRAALRLDPECDEARLHLAEGLLVYGKPAEALEHFQYLQGHSDESLALLLGLARCRRRLGEPEEARRLLDEAADRFPPNQVVLRERGEVELEAGRVAEAIRWLRRALAVDAHDAHTCYGLSRALRQAGQAKEADEYLKRSEDIERQGQRLQAILKELGKRPGDAGLYCEAGVLCLQNGQDQEGLRWLEGALHADPHHRPTHRALADYYERRGQPELAREHRREAGEAGPPQAARP